MSTALRLTPSRLIPNAITPTPTRTSVVACGATTWVLASSCESAGLISRKSKVPSRMPSISASIEGRITIPISPAMKKWMPISTSRSSGPQPRRSAVAVKITDSASTWVTRLITALSSETAKSERYCTRFSTPRERKARSHPEAVSHAPTAEYRRVARRHSSASPAKAPARSSPAGRRTPSRSPPRSRRPSSTSTGKARLQENGVHTATVCIQPGSTASGANIAAEEGGQGEEQGVDRGHLGQPERGQGQAPLDHEAQHHGQHQGGQEGQHRAARRCPDRSASKTRPSSTAAGSTPTSPTVL